MSAFKSISIALMGFFLVVLSGCNDNSATPTTSSSPFVQPSQSPEIAGENEKLEILKGNLDLDNKTYTIHYQEKFDKGNGETTNFAVTITYELSLRKLPSNESGYFIYGIQVIDRSFSPEDYLFFDSGLSSSDMQYEKNHQIVKFPVEFKIVQTDYTLSSAVRQSINKFNIVIDLTEDLAN